MRKITLSAFHWRAYILLLAKILPCNLRKPEKGQGGARIGYGGLNRGGTGAG
jgi:hypothetical protein